MLQTLAEQAKAAIDPDLSKKFEEKFASGDDFTLVDFLSQLQSIKRWARCQRCLECCLA